MNFQTLKILRFIIALGLASAIDILAAEINATLPTIEKTNTSQLRIISWGGSYAAAQQRAVFTPFIQANPDINITLHDNAYLAADLLRKQAGLEKGRWDIIDVLAKEAIELCDEGVAEPIKHNTDLAPSAALNGGSKTRLSVIEDFGNTIVSDCFIPQFVYSKVLAYRSDSAFKKTPSKPADLFDLASFPGKRALQKVPQGNLEWALIADGVPIQNVYNTLGSEAGIQRAFAKLDSIKAHILWWEGGNEPALLLSEKKVVMASAYNGILFSAIEENKQPIKIIWNGQIQQIEGWVIPKNAPNKKALQKFIRFASDPKNLAGQSHSLAYGPARLSALQYVRKHTVLDIDMLPHLPTAPENTKHALLFNERWWAKNAGKLEKRFTLWLNQ